MTPWFPNEDELKGCITESELDLRTCSQPFQMTAMSIENRGFEGELRSVGWRENAFCPEMAVLTGSRYLTHSFEIC